MLDELITWGNLSTLPILVLVTYLIVNFTKDLIDKIPSMQNIGTFRYGLIVAFLLQMAVAIGDKAVGYQAVVLIIVNSFIIELAAAQVNDAAVKQHTKKITENLNGMGR